MEAPTAEPTRVERCPECGGPLTNGGTIRGGHTVTAFDYCAGCGSMLGPVYNYRESAIEPEWEPPTGFVDP